MTDRCMVVSAVNFTDGGPLTILTEFVRAACEVLPSEWRIVVFLHDRGLLTSDRAKVIEIPYTKTSWIRRLWFEWYECRKYARSMKPDLWVSLHDISPNVGSVPQVVYCHNPAPFFKLNIQDAYLEPRLLLFRLAYGLLYRVNLRKNVAVIVQQSWIRQEFCKWTDVNTRVVVAHPTTVGCPQSVLRRRLSNSAIFLYPALSRVFKNIELVCRAVQCLESDPSWQSVVVLTVDGSENRYARWLKTKYGGMRTIRFAGKQTREQMNRLYAEVDCLLFPSRLETWGLPITEAKQLGMPVFVADLPYARESVGTYSLVDFVNVSDHEALAAKMLAFQAGNFSFPGASAVMPELPYVSGFADLVQYITEDYY